MLELKANPMLWLPASLSRRTSTRVAARLLPFSSSAVRSNRAIRLSLARLRSCSRPVDPAAIMPSEGRLPILVEIFGLSSVPTAGDEFRVFEDERDARKLAEGACDA